MSSVARDATFELAGRQCRHRDLSAAQQFAMLRRLQPVFPALTVMDAARAALRGPKALAGALEPLLALPDAVIEAALNACLEGCQELDGSSVGTPAEPADILVLLLAMFSHNFGPMLNMSRPVNAEPVTTDRDRGYGIFGQARMPDEQDWLYAPVMAEPPLCTVRELYDGTYRIEDVALMNDLLRVKTENAARWREANRET